MPKTSGKPAATPADIYNNAILPAAKPLDTSHLGYSVSWNKSNMPLQVDTQYEKATGNTVTVTVTYQWFPEMYLIGPYALTSTSTAQNGVLDELSGGTDRKVYHAQPKSKLQPPHADSPPGQTRSHCRLDRVLPDAHFGICGHRDRWRRAARLHRQTQSTADAAALAAAEDLFVNYPQNKGVDSGTAVARATAIAATNGFTNDGTKSIVTVRVNPQTYLDGPNKGTTVPKGYVEVTVQYNQPRYFSAVIGSGAIPVSARAVARGKWEPAFVGIHVLDLHQKGA